MGRSRGRSVAWEWIRARGCAWALLPERSVMQRASYMCTHSRKIVSEMTYNVSSGTLNSTIPYHTIPYHGYYPGLFIMQIVHRLAGDIPNVFKNTFLEIVGALFFASHILFLMPNQLYQYKAYTWFLNVVIDNVVCEGSEKSLWRGCRMWLSFC